MLGKPELIGIDIGQYSIKVARLKAGKKISISQLIYEVVPKEVREHKDHEAMKSLVSNAVKKAKASNGQPVIHVNAGDAILREVKVAEGLRVDELEGAVELELSESLPFGVDQVYFDFDDKENEKGLIQTAAVRRDIADAKVTLLDKLPKSFKSAQVDIDAYAYGRVLHYLTKTQQVADQHLPVMIVDIGYTRSRFYVYEAGELKFHREQQIGGYQATEIIMDVLEISHEEAEDRKLNMNFGDEYQEAILTPFVQTFAEQLNLAIDFYEATRNEDAEIKAIYCVGGGSKLSGLIPALDNYINQSVSLFDQVLSTTHPNYGNDFILAMGLAIEGDR